MPTYEYACTSCGHRFDAVQSFSDAALTTCPVCQGPLRKVFGNVGIVLKGSGFYKTDSRSSKAGSSNGSGSSNKEPVKEKVDAAPAGGEASSKEPATKKDPAPTPSSSSSASGGSAPASDG